MQLILRAGENMDMMIDITKAKLETNRLTLRAWREEDINDFFEYACVDGVGEAAGWRHHESIDISHKILNLFISEKNVYAIEYKENKRVIGSLGLHYSWANDDSNYSNFKSKEIGYVLSKEYWGNGLAPEAVMAVIHFYFEQYGLDALTCGHFMSNHQSKRVIEKCGFSFVKKSEYYAKQLDKTFDDMKYILIK